MNKYFLFFGFLFLLVSCQRNDNNVIVKISKAKSQAFIMYSRDISTYPKGPVSKDTIFSKRGVIRFDIKYPLSQVLIIPQKQNTSKANNQMPPDSAFTIELICSNQDKINVEGTLLHDRLNYHAKGNQISTDISSLRSTYIDDIAVYDNIKGQLDSIQKVGSATPTSQMKYQARMINDKILGKQIQYIKDHPNSQYAGFLILKQSREVFLECYKALSSEVKEGMFKSFIKKLFDSYRDIQRIIDLEKNVEIGRQAPNFTLKNASGKEFSLYSLKSKFVLLDFWQTWCTPAIEAFPRLKKYYLDNSDRLEIISIVCDDKFDNWQEIIKQQKLPWPQLINKKFDKTSEDMRMLYAISGYPTRIVLDRDKKIILKFVGESKQFYKKLQDLIN